MLSLTTAWLFPDNSSAETCSQWIAKAVSVQGNITVQRVNEIQWLPVKLNDLFCPGDAIRVQEKSRAGFLLSNESIIRLNQNTALTFLDEEKTPLIKLITGIVHFFSRFPNSLKINTPFVNGSVEGTEFTFNVEGDKAFISVFEGKVTAKNNSGVIVLTEDQSAVAEKGQAPKRFAVVRPRDSVQWALYYPAIFYKRSTDPAMEWQMKVSSLLSVGRVDEAEQEIEAVIALEQHNSDALAIQSVIAVVRNEKDSALKLADSAINANPASSPAHIALSYARQANFDLAGAISSINNALRLEPDNVFAWARLSELHLSIGNITGAMQSASKAVELSPGLSHTQTILGFAYLSMENINDAKSAFEKAITMDQADPLPRLGLGLAEIREGNLDSGRKEIGIAASLNPNNSLIRSYLGKSYYESNLDKKASAQLETAKKLDPSDPTPFFYDAIRKQSMNQPVDAIHDIQKAIALNDNRAVYRSRLLLDSDLAARSAGLARIYSDLGFQQIALVEGWRSISTDPSNYSAHRFLADSYSVLPRHEIARVSELLQSQLLQPLNITPLQPHLAESNLSILNGAGPSDLSFNEFNPLFNSNRYAFQVSGIAGSNNTAGNELVLSGVHGKGSFSIGQFHYETDGFRENSDQRKDIFNLFSQISPSTNTSIQAELRYMKTLKGDLTLNFFPDDFLPSLAQDEEIKSARIGMHHSISSASDILGSVMLHSAEFDFQDSSVPDLSFAKKTRSHSYSAEFQHLLRSEHLNIISGAGHFRINSDDFLTIEIAGNPPEIYSDKIEEDVRHNNLYLYAHINYFKNMTLTAGGSADFFKNNDDNRKQFNPKIGLTWNPHPDTTLRTAVFRVFKRTLLTDQTIEPTQVAGFNQFFDDINDTDSWRYGAAVDHKFTKDIYGGAEYSMRNLIVPFTFISDQAQSPELRRGDWKEQAGRSYVYWTACKSVSLSVEYQYERFDRNQEFPFGIEKLETNSFPIGIHLFHTSGFIAKLKSSYIIQRGVLVPQLTGTPAEGKDHFWVTDILINYRLRNRSGLISIGIKNLFDDFFKFQDTDLANPEMLPERQVFFRITLAL